MQPSWLENTYHKLIYRIIVGLIVGITIGLICNLTLGWFIALFLGLIASFSETIKPVHTLKWSWQSAIPKGVIFWLTVVGLISALISGVTAGLNYGLIHGLTFTLIPLQFVIVTFMLSGMLIEFKEKAIAVPNQSIKKSAKNVASIILPCSLLWAGGIFLLNLGQPQTERLEWILMFELIIVLMAAMVFGGLAYLQHFVLRLILCYGSKSIPWNYAKFLNYASERLFMQRIGGRYRFIHDLLREHFANM